MKVKLRSLKTLKIVAEIDATPCVVEGCDVVLALHQSNYEQDLKLDATDIWRVTEPKTGLVIGRGATRKQAKANTEALIAKEREIRGLSTDQCAVTAAVNVLTKKFPIAFRD